MAKNDKALTKVDGAGLAKPGEINSLLREMGMTEDESAQFEQVQTGGVTRWLNLKAFQEDPSLPQNKPVKGTGAAFGGILLGRQEMQDEQGEENADGMRVRYFYTFKLLSECPVTFKEGEEVIETIAKPGEIISVGERHALRNLRELTENGGVYAVVIRPHSRISIGRGQTMWTFDMWQRVIKPPIKVKAELVQKTPF